MPRYVKIAPAGPLPSDPPASTAPEASTAADASAAEASATEASAATTAPPAPPALPPVPLPPDPLALPAVPLPPAPTVVPPRLPSPPPFPPARIAPSWGAPPSDADMSGRLRHLIAQRGKPLICPGVYDGLTAKIAIEQGFKALYITQTAALASLLGRSDLDTPAPGEMTRNARVIAGIAYKSGVPVIAEVHPSFGGLTVELATRAYIRSGIAGIILSDIEPTGLTTQRPETNVMSGRDFYSLIHRASDERTLFSKDIVIIARSVGRESLGFDRTARRLKTVTTQGADVVWLQGADATEKPAFYELVKDTPVMHCMDRLDHSPYPPTLEAGIHNDHIILFPDVVLGTVLRSVREATKYLMEHSRNPASAHYDPQDLERLLSQIQTDGQ